METPEDKKRETEMIKQNNNAIKKHYEDAIAILYSNNEISKDELFWEILDEPYKSILEEY